MEYESGTNHSAINTRYPSVASNTRYPSVASNTRYPSADTALKLGRRRRTQNSILPRFSGHPHAVHKPRAAHRLGCLLVRLLQKGECGGDQLERVHHRRGGVFNRLQRPLSHIGAHVKKQGIRAHGASPHSASPRDQQVPVALIADFVVVSETMRGRGSARCATSDVISARIVAKPAMRKG